MKDDELLTPIPQFRCRDCAYAEQLEGMRFVKCKLLNEYRSENDSCLSFRPKEGGG